MPKIQVDEEVYKLLEFGRELTGWTHSQVIAKAAQVKRDKLLTEAEALRGLAELAPENPEPPTPHTVEIRQGPNETVIKVDEASSPGEILDAVEAVGEVARERAEELRKPLDVRPSGDTPESEEESVEAPKTSAARPKPRDIIDMLHDGALKVSSKWHLALPHGREVVFKLNKDGEFVDEGDQQAYDTPNKAVKAHDYTKSAWDGLRDKSDKPLRDYWQGWQSA